MQKVFHVIYDIPTVITGQKEKLKEILTTVDYIRCDERDHDIQYTITDNRKQTNFKTIHLRPVYDMGLRTEVTEIQFYNKGLTQRDTKELFYHIPDTDLLTIAYNQYQAQERRRKKEIRQTRELVNNFLNTFTYDKIKTI